MPPKTHDLSLSSAWGAEFFSRGVLGTESQVGQGSANTQPRRVLEGSAEPGGVERNVGKQPRHVREPKTIAAAPLSQRAAMGNAC